jgi:hypothetical protein
LESESGSEPKEGLLRYEMRLNDPKEGSTLHYESVTLQENEQVK